MINQEDLTIVAMTQDGVTTAWIRGYSGITVQGDSEKMVRLKLKEALSKYFLNELVKLDKANYAHSTITVTKSNGIMNG